MDVLKPTFGPRGRHVMLQYDGEKAKITREGFEIADSFILENIYENLGVSLLRGVCLSAHTAAGDGAVMAAIIARDLARSCQKIVQAGYSIVDLRTGLQKGNEMLKKILANMARPVKNRKQMEHLMLTSSGGDTWMIDIIFQVQKKLGPQGILSFSLTDGVEDEVILREGMSFEESLLSPHFDDFRNTSTELDDPLILVYADKIADMEKLIKFVERIVEYERPLFFIAEGISEDALSLLLLNNKNGTMRSIGVKAPAFGDRRVELLKDIAVYTGAEVVGNAIGRDISDVNIEDLGKAKKVRFERSRTIIMDGGGHKSEIKNRIKEIRAQIKKESTEFDNHRLEDRIAKITSGVANIRVGGYTERDKEQRRRQITSVYKVLRAGIKNGFINGGGLGLLEAAVKLKKVRNANSYAVPFGLLANALEKPIGILAENSDVNGDYIIEKIRENGFKSGFNALKGKIEKTSSMKIIDPLQTTLAAINAAISLSVNLLSSEIFIWDKPYVLAHDEAPQLGLKGYKGMQGIPGLEHDHE